MTELYNGLKVLSVYHRKGGVGKTFLTTTAAYLLANGGPDGKGKKRRVFILDYDAQQDASTFFLKMIKIPGADEYKPPIHPQYQEIEDPHWNGVNSSSDILFDASWYEYPTPFENIHILPSEGNVDRINNLPSESDDLVDAIAKQTISLFDDSSDTGLQGDYDIVIIDNPPSKTAVSSGLLKASSHVLIPTEAEYDSTSGAPMLLNRIKQINIDRGNMPPIEIVGIVPNKIKGATDRWTNNTKLSMGRLYKEDSTKRHMANFFIRERECYKTSEKPTRDSKMFNYVHNQKAIAEMRNLYHLLEDALWGNIHD